MKFRTSPKNTRLLAKKKGYVTTEGNLPKLRIWGAGSKDRNSDAGVIRAFSTAAYG